MQKFFGTAFGLTSKVPKSSFTITQGETKEHSMDNGSGTVLFREFCPNCGTGILEYGVCMYGFFFVDPDVWERRHLSGMGR